MIYLYNRCILCLMIYFTLLNNGIWFPFGAESPLTETGACCTSASIWNLFFFFLKSSVHICSAYLSSESCFSVDRYLVAPLVYLALTFSLINVFHLSTLFGKFGCVFVRVILLSNVFLTLSLRLYWAFWHVLDQNIPIHSPNAMNDMNFFLYDNENDHIRIRDIFCVKARK